MVALSIVAPFAHWLGSGCGGAIFKVGESFGKAKVSLLGPYSSFSNCRLHAF